MDHGAGGGKTIGYESDIIGSPESIYSNKVRNACISFLSLYCGSKVH